MKKSLIPSVYLLLLGVGLAYGQLFRQPPDDAQQGGERFGYFQNTLPTLSRDGQLGAQGYSEGQLPLLNKILESTYSGGNGDARLNLLGESGNSSILKGDGLSGTAASGRNGRNASGLSQIFTTLPFTERTNLSSNGNQSLLSNGNSSVTVREAGTITSNLQDNIIGSNLLNNQFVGVQGVPQNGINDRQQFTGADWSSAVLNGYTARPPLQYNWGVPASSNILHGNTGGSESLGLFSPQAGGEQAGRFVVGNAPSNNLLENGNVQLGFLGNSGQILSQGNSWVPNWLNPFTQFSQQAAVTPAPIAPPVTLGNEGLRWGINGPQTSLMGFAPGQSSLSGEAHAQPMTVHSEGPVSVYAEPSHEGALNININLSGHEEKSNSVLEHLPHQGAPAEIPVAININLIGNEESHIVPEIHFNVGPQAGNIPESVSHSINGNNSIEEKSPDSQSLDTVEKASNNQTYVSKDENYGSEELSPATALEFLSSDKGESLKPNNLNSVENRELQTPSGSFSFEQQSPEPVSETSLPVNKLDTLSDSNIFEYSLGQSSQDGKRGQEFSIEKVAAGNDATPFQDENQTDEINESYNEQSEASQSNENGPLEFLEDGNSGQSWSIESNNDVETISQPSSFGWETEVNNRPNYAAEITTQEDYSTNEVEREPLNLGENLWQMTETSGLGLTIEQQVEPEKLDFTNQIAEPENWSLQSVDHGWPQEMNRFGRDIVGDEINSEIVLDHQENNSPSIDGGTDSVDNLNSEAETLKQNDHSGSEGESIQLVMGSKEQETPAGSFSYEFNASHILSDEGPVEESEIVRVSTMEQQRNNSEIFLSSPLNEYNFEQSSHNSEPFVEDREELAQSNQTIIGEQELRDYTGQWMALAPLPQSLQPEESEDNASFNVNLNGNGEILSKSSSAGSESRESINDVAPDVLQDTLEWNATTSQGSVGEIQWEIAERLDIAPTESPLVFTPKNQDSEGNQRKITNASGDSLNHAINNDTASESFWVRPENSNVEAENLGSRPQFQFEILREQVPDTESEERNEFPYFYLSPSNSDQTGDATTTTTNWSFDVNNGGDTGLNANQIVRSPSSENSLSWSPNLELSLGQQIQEPASQIRLVGNSYNWSESSLPGSFEEILGQSSQVIEPGQELLVESQERDNENFEGNQWSNAPQSFEWNFNQTIRDVQNVSNMLNITEVSVERMPQSSLDFNFDQSSQKNGPQEGQTEVTQVNLSINRTTSEAEGVLNGQPSLQFVDIGPKSQSLQPTNKHPETTEEILNINEAHEAEPESPESGFNDSPRSNGEQLQTIELQDQSLAGSSEIDEDIPTSQGQGSINQHLNQNEEAWNVSPIMNDGLGNEISQAFYQTGEITKPVNNITEYGAFEIGPNQNVYVNQKVVEDNLKDQVNFQISSTESILTEKNQGDINLNEGFSVERVQWNVTGQEPTLAQTTVNSTEGSNNSNLPTDRFSKYDSYATELSIESPNFEGRLSSIGSHRVTPGGEYDLNLNLSATNERSKHSSGWAGQDSSDSETSRIREILGIVPDETAAKISDSTPQVEIDFSPNRSSEAANTAISADYSVDNTGLGNAVVENVHSTVGGDEAQAKVHITASSSEDIPATITTLISPDEAPSMTVTPSTQSTDWGAHVVKPQSSGVGNQAESTVHTISPKEDNEVAQTKVHAVSSGSSAAPTTININSSSREEAPTVTVAQQGVQASGQLGGSILVKARPNGGDQSQAVVRITSHDRETTPLNITTTSLGEASSLIVSQQFRLSNDSTETVMNAQPQGQEQAEISIEVEPLISGSIPSTQSNDIQETTSNLPESQEQVNAPIVALFNDSSHVDGPVMLREDDEDDESNSPTENEPEMARNAFDFENTGSQVMIGSNSQEATEIELSTSLSQENLNNTESESEIQANQVVGPPGQQADTGSRIGEHSGSFGSSNFSPAVDSALNQGSRAIIGLQEKQVGGNPQSVRWSTDGDVPFSVAGVSWASESKQSESIMDGSGGSTSEGLLAPGNQASHSEQKSGNQERHDNNESSSQTPLSHGFHWNNGGDTSGPTSFIKWEKTDGDESGRLFSLGSEFPGTPGGDRLNWSTRPNAVAQGEVNSEPAGSEALWGSDEYPRRNEKNSGINPSPIGEAQREGSSGESWKVGERPAHSAITHYGTDTSEGSRDRGVQSSSGRQWSTSGSQWNSEHDVPTDGSQWIVHSGGRNQPGSSDSEENFSNERKQDGSGSGIQLSEWSPSLTSRGEKSNVQRWETQQSTLPSFSTNLEPMENQASQINQRPTVTTIPDNHRSTSTSGNWWHYGNSDSQPNHQEGINWSVQHDSDLSGEQNNAASNRRPTTSNDPGISWVGGNSQPSWNRDYDREDQWLTIDRSGVAPSSTANDGQPGREIWSQRGPGLQWNGATNGQEEMMWNVRPNSGSESSFYTQHAGNNGGGRREHRNGGSSGIHWSDENSLNRGENRGNRWSQVDDRSSAPSVLTGSSGNQRGSGIQWSSTNSDTSPSRWVSWNEREGNQRHQNEVENQISTANAAGPSMRWSSNGASSPSWTNREGRNWGPTWISDERQASSSEPSGSGIRWINGNQVTTPGSSSGTRWVSTQSTPTQSWTNGDEEQIHHWTNSGGGQRPITSDVTSNEQSRNQVSRFVEQRPTGNSHFSGNQRQSYNIEGPTFQWSSGNAGAIPSQSSSFTTYSGPREQNARQTGNYVFVGGSERGEAGEESRARWSSLPNGLVRSIQPTASVGEETTSTAAENPVTVEKELPSVRADQESSTVVESTRQELETPSGSNSSTKNSLTSSVSTEKSSDREQKTSSGGFFRKSIRSIGKFLSSGPSSKNKPEQPKQDEQRKKEVTGTQATQDNAGDASKVSRTVG